MGDNSDTNIKIDITANADGVAPGVSVANKELDKLSNSTSEFEKKQRAAVDTSEKMAHATGRTREQFVQLGKEVATGETGRIPETLARIAFGFGPIGIAVGAVTAAVGAGVWAWTEWGDEAEKAMKKVSDALAESEKDRAVAERGIRRTLEEQVRDLDIKRQIAAGELNVARNEHARITRETDSATVMKLGQTLGNRRSELAAYERQIADIKARIAEDENKQTGKDGREQDRVTAEIERARKLEQSKTEHALSAAQDKYEQLNLLEDGFFDDDKTSAGRKLSYDLMVMEREYQANVELLQRNKASQTELDQLDRTYQESKLARTELTWKEIEKIEKDANKKAAKESSDIWKTFADNTQRTLSDVLYNGMNGQFNNIEEMFKQMLFRMAANAASANLSQAMFGTNGKSGGDSNGWIGSIIKWFASANGNAFGDGGVYAFANGGTFSDGLYDKPTPFKFASGGGFSLGVMGEAGPEAVMPLSRDSEGKLGVRAEGGGGTTIVVNDNSVITVDARSDRAQALSEINQLVDAKQARLVETLRRERSIA